jgi:peptidyl-prolyl cis-trans isomerase B (cyclophilin B)
MLQVKPHKIFMNAIIYTSYGPITIELVSGRCELTLMNFVRYIHDGFYDDTLFHRVVDSYLVQGGGFERGFIQKATRAPIRNESADGLSNKRGTIAMARLPDESDSATSQFFFNMQDNPSLDYHYSGNNDLGYCAFGRVIEGMRFIDRINCTGTRTIGDHRDVPTEEIVIERMELVH